MYKIDSKYLKQVDHDGHIYFLNEDGTKRAYDRHNTGRNCNDYHGSEWQEPIVKFDKINFSKKHSKFAGTDIFVARHGEDGHHFSYLTKDGLEIGQFEDRYGSELITENDVFIDSEIARYAAQNPKIIEHMPVEMFLKRKWFGEEILTNFQRIKMEELKQLSAGQDSKPFVDDVKNTVAYMNKTFNNIEKTRQAKENFEGLFERNREI